MLTGLFTEISARPVGLARIVIGAAVLARAVVTWSLMSRLADPVVLVSPYFSLMPEPTHWLAVVTVSIWVVSGVLFLVGWRISLVGPILLGTIAFTLALDQQLYSNHLYLMAWLVLLLTIADAGSGLSLGREDRPVLRWPVLLLMIQASIVYGFSGLTKLNAQYLSGEVLAGSLGTGLVPFPDALRTPTVLSLLAAVTVIVELFIAVFLWRQRFRPIAILLGFALHLSITLSVARTLQLFVFSLEMLALYPLFLSRGDLVAGWDGECRWCRGWVRRFRRLDVLKTLEIRVGPDGATDNLGPSIHLTHAGSDTGGFDALTRILEHLVPTLWVAPFLRIPGVRRLGNGIYRWRARRQSCGLDASLR